jgi:hypothetical protein
MGLRVGCATVPSKTEVAAIEPSATLMTLFHFESVKIDRYPKTLEFEDGGAGNRE